MTPDFGLSLIVISYLKVMEKNSESGRKVINRRDFIFKLGIGATIVVSGYYISGHILENRLATIAESVSKPLLKKNVISYYKRDELFLEYQNSKFCVNETGAEIIRLLNGKNTVSDISSMMSRSLNLEQTDLLDSSIAGFICQLAETGFIADPFYVTLYENYE